MITIYVSNSGSDGHLGLTPDQPLRTIRFARTKLKAGQPGQMLLKRGDVFREGTISWELHGKSDDEPMVFSSYGDGPRPILDETAISYYWNTGYPSGFSLNHLVISGIAFCGDFKTFGAGANSTGLLLSGPMRDVTIINCAFSGYDSGVNIQIRNQVDELMPAGISFRNNIVVENETFGLLISGGSGVTIEDNLFDHNGHGGQGPTILKHNVYLKDVRNATIRGNIIARGGNFGTKLSSDKPSSFTGFVIQNNLYYNNGIGMDHSAGATGDPMTTFTHESGVVVSNVFTELGRTFSNGVKQDLAGWLLNTRKVTWTRNLFVHKPPVSTGVILNWGKHHESILVTNNIVHNWHLQDGLPESSYLEHKAADVITSGTFERNKINRPASEYRDALRTVGTYQKSIGGADDAIQFLLDCRAAKNDPRYTAAAVNQYLRDGFSDSPQEPEPEPVSREQKLISDIRALLDAYETGR